MSSLPLAIARLSVYATLTFLLMPVQLVAVLLRSRVAVELPRVYHHICCRLLGFHVVTSGTPSRERPTLIIANHATYLDITVLGSVIGGSFVAKAEVAGWPFFGWLAKLQRTVFVDRRRASSATQRDDIAERLDAGDTLILFPEGTSSDGNRTLPFKSALFSVAERTPKGRPLTVQPVSVAYVRLNGVPIGRALRPFLAWYGDMNLFGHLVRAAGLGHVEIRVHFHPVVTLPQLGSRKALSAHCHRQVAEGMAALLRSRDPAAGLNREGPDDRYPAVPASATIQDRRAGEAQ